jgi:hypothetical protein
VAERRLIARMSSLPVYAPSCNGLSGRPSIFEIDQGRDPYHLRVLFSRLAILEVALNRQLTPRKSPTPGKIRTIFPFAHFREQNANLNYR